MAPVIENQKGNKIMISMIPATERILTEVFNGAVHIYSNVTKELGSLKNLILTFII